MVTGGSISAPPLPVVSPPLSSSQVNRSEKEQDALEVLVPTDLYECKAHKAALNWILSSVKVYKWTLKFGFKQVYKGRQALLEVSMVLYGCKDYKPALKPDFNKVHYGALRSLESGLKAGL